jgi:RNA polymerase sigma factor (sigma-70 family)
MDGASNMPDVPDPVGLVRALAWKAARVLVRHGDVRELVSEGWLQYERCRRTYREGTGATFTTYAYSSVELAMRGYVSGLHRNGYGPRSWGAEQPGRVCIDDLPWIADPGAERGIMEHVEFIVDRERVLRAAHSISSRHREIMRYRLEGMTQVEAASRVGISRKRAQEIEEEVKEKIAAAEARYVNVGCRREQDYGRDRISDAEPCRWCGEAVAWVRPDAVWHKVDAAALSAPLALRTKATRYPHRCAAAARALEGAR